MATTFALIPQKYIDKYNIKQDSDGIDENSGLYDEGGNDPYIICAFRSNGGVCYWNLQFKVLTEFISDDTKVYALENSAQGIFTVGDLKKEIDGK